MAAKESCICQVKLLAGEVIRVSTSHAQGPDPREEAARRKFRPLIVIEIGVLQNTPLKNQPV